MNLINIFATPMWQTVYENFDQEKDLIVKSIEEFKKINKDSVKLPYTTNDVYVSPRKFQTVTPLSPLFNFFCQFGMKASFDINLTENDTYITAAWIEENNTKNSLSFEHIHHDTFTGIFYVKVSENAGKLVINNPSINPLWQGCLITEGKNKFTSEKVKIQPSEGSLVLWPSYLSHYVEPSEEDGENVSICFNLICVPRNKEIENTR